MVFYKNKYCIFVDYTAVVIIKQSDRDRVCE